MIFANSYYKMESRKLKAERILRSAFLHIHTKNNFLWYNIIEYGSDECKAIERDALIEMLGEYETTHIYDGEYDEQGKVYDRGSIPMP